LAKVDIKMPDAYLEKLSGLGSDFDKVAEKVLKNQEVKLKKQKPELDAD